MNLQHPSYFMLIHLMFVSADDVSLHFECESSCASQISTKKLVQHSCPLYIHILSHSTLNSSCRQVLQFSGVISGLNQPEWDNIGPAELIVLQGCSHYSASKNLKSKSILNLRNSIRACFHFKFSHTPPPQFTRLPYILP